MPRGIRDIEPEEYERLEYIRSRFAEIARLFDFKIMEPAPIEMLKTLEAKSGSMIRQEIYAFKDKASRDIALRFDLTVGLTRYVTSRRDLALPIKLASFAGVWRYDEPQLGRYRWFHQWDVEVYDNFSIESDAEVIEFTANLLESIGLNNVRIALNDRLMLENYLKDRFDVNKQLIDEYFRALDKSSKKSKDELLREYHMLDHSILEHMLDLKGIDSIEELQELKMDTSRLESLLDSLKSRRVKNASIDLSIVRGLDYYSSIVFEAFASNSKNAIVGGGRYDKLTSVFGRSDLGATGAAGGVERILALLKYKQSRNNKVFVAFTNPRFKNKAIEIASLLRKSNIISSAELSNRTLRKQLEYASKNGYGKVIILADKEFGEGKVILRDMEYRVEDKVRLEDIFSNVDYYLKH